MTFIIFIENILNNEVIMFLISFTLLPTSLRTFITTTINVNDDNNHLLFNKNKNH